MGKTEIFTFFLLGTCVVLIFIFIFLWIILQYRKRRMEYMHEKNTMTEMHKRQMLSTQLAMQQQTMQEIGREIHDNVGQKLTLASIYAQQLAYENKAPHINQTIEDIGRIVNESLQDLRNLSKTLTQEGLETKSLNELIKEEVEKVKHAGTCNVVANIDFNSARIDTLKKQAVIRLVQEFLQNSLKHADCKNIFINGTVMNEAIHLEMNDDGKGFEIDAIKKAGIDLSNMKQRVQHLNGTCDIRSSPGNGTSIIINIPLT